MFAMSRLTWRSAAFEIAAFSLLSGLLTVAMIAFTIWLRQSPPSTACFVSGPVGDCSSARSFFDLSATASKVIQSVGLLPIAIGGVLGSQLFSKDIERGSMQLPWSLSPSRSRWFFERLLISGSIVAALLTAVAIAATALEAAIHPNVGPGDSLMDLGLRGPSLVALGIAAFSLAAVCGLMLGRSFPALLAGVAAAAIVGVISQPLAVVTQPSEVISQMGRPQVSFAIVRDDMYQMRDGKLLTLNEATALVPPGTEDPPTWIGANLKEVAVGVPGQRYLVVEAVWCAILLAVSASSILVGLVVVRRRRPY